MNDQTTPLHILTGFALAGLLMRGSDRDDAYAAARAVELAQQTLEQIEMATALKQKAA